MASYEGFRLKVLKFIRITFANNRNKKIKNKNFTIISNNCWGGMVYESYGLKKMSPTIGLYFMGSDYINFLENMDNYLNMDLEFIELEESKWKNFLKEIDCPIGRLKDIEIFFLHYKDVKDVKEKWTRRCQRINRDKMIVKFNDQNGCTLDDVKRFLELPYRNKLFFTCRDWEVKHNGEIIKINQWGNKNFIKTSYEPFGKSKYLDLHRLINSL